MKLCESFHITAEGLRPMVPHCCSPSLCACLGLGSVPFSVNTPQVADPCAVRQFSSKIFKFWTLPTSNVLESAIQTVQCRHTVSMSQRRRMSDESDNKWQK